MGILSKSNCTSNDLLVQRRSGWAGSKGRLRREDCRSVKHDKLFSKWKVLVGPLDSASDQVASLGQEISTGKFHTHNLPASAECGPGVYELGVTAPSWSKQPNVDQRRIRALKRGDVIPVYIGQAANIRQRLHKYGLAGSHLEPGNSRSPQQHRYYGRSPRRGGSGSVSPASRGHRLFSEVLALGSCIAFRWAQTDSKVVAEQVESELLAVFDYAWNKGGSSSGSAPLRSRDILAKLFMAWPAEDHTPFRKLMYFSSKKLLWLIPCTGPQSRSMPGIKVALRKPANTSSQTRRRVCFLMTLGSRDAIKVAASLDLRSATDDHHKGSSPCYAHAHAFAQAPYLRASRTRSPQHVETKRLGRGQPPPPDHPPNARIFAHKGLLTRSLCKVSADSVKVASVDTRRRHNSLSFNTWMSEGDSTDLNQCGEHDNTSGMKPAMIKQKSGTLTYSRRRVRHLGSSLPDNDCLRR